MPCRRRRRTGRPASSADRSSSSIAATSSSLVADRDDRHLPLDQLLGDARRADPARPERPHRRRRTSPTLGSDGACRRRPSRRREARHRHASLDPRADHASARPARPAWSRAIREFERSPSAVLRRRATRSAHPKRRGDGDRERHRRKGPSDQLHDRAVRVSMQERRHRSILPCRARKRRKPPYWGAGDQSPGVVVGLTRIELVTSALSGQRSNRLSYSPGKSATLSADTGLPHHTFGASKQPMRGGAGHECTVSGRSRCCRRRPTRG